MEVLAISNQKGGVGKTVIGVHKAIYLAEMAHKVIFIDFDSQGNASDTLSSMSSVAELRASELFNSTVSPLAAKNGITLISADNAMADVDRADTSVLSTLKKNMDVISKGFDFCIIDTPPSLGLRMTAALLVADHVLAPIELENYSIKGIEKMLGTIFNVKKQWNPKLNFLGMLPNRFNGRSQAQKDTLASLTSNYEHLIINAPISLRSTIPEALNEGVPVWKLRKTTARIAGNEFKIAFKIVLDKIQGVK